MIYPIVLLCMATAILTFLVTLALPKVANVFSQSGINPPWFSEIVFTVGLFIGANILIILPGALIAHRGAHMGGHQNGTGEKNVQSFSFEPSAHTDGV